MEDGLHPTTFRGLNSLMLFDSQYVCSRLHFLKMGTVLEVPSNRDIGKIH